MADFIVEVRNLDNTQLLEGVTVTLDWDFFGAAQKAEAITDNKGQVSFNVNVYNTTISVKASKNGSIDKETVQVNLLGGVTPNKVIMNLAFKPLEKVGDNIDTFFNEIKNNARTLTIGVAVVGSIVGVLYLINWAKSTKPKLPQINTPNLKGDSKP